MKDYTVCCRCGQEGHLSYACKLPVPPKATKPEADIWKDSSNPDVEINQRGERRTKVKPLLIPEPVVAPQVEQVEQAIEQVATVVTAVYGFCG